MRKRSTWALMALVLVAFAGCRSLPGAAPREIRPEAIEASVRAQIATEFPSDTFSIGVSVSDQGVVTLTGSVETAAQRARIGELAASVQEVRRVDNRLTIG
jgi:osmotically-inducible protein OsmY